MKLLTLITVLLITPQSVFSQALAVPTMAQIFNFAVGDTFEYSYNSEDTPNGGPDCAEGYLLDVITGVQTLAPDTMHYSYKSAIDNTRQGCVYLEPNGPFPGNAGSVYIPLSQLYNFPVYWADSGSFMVYGLDSTIFNSIELNISLSQCDSQSSHCQSCTCVDSVYTNSNYEGRTQSLFVTTSIGISEVYADSIGLVMLNDFNESLSVAVTENLVYYHKADGPQWGAYMPLVTGLNNINPPVQRASIIPDPATADFEFAISLQPTTETYLKIYNIMGQEVRQSNINSMITQFQCPELSKGLYFWALYTGNEISANGKFILQ